MSPFLLIMVPQVSIRLETERYIPTDNEQIQPMSKLSHNRMFWLLQRFPVLYQWFYVAQKGL